MKCPNCGREMAEGTLYCEYCGEDIHIVPDFEPELEQNIQQTIHEIVADIGQEEKENRAPKQTAEPDAAITRKPRGRYLWRFLLVLGILVAVAAAGMGIWVYQYNSESFQLAKASEYVAAADYDRAVACYSRALELDGENIELQFSLAEVYFLKNNKIEYEYVLRNIARNPNATEEQLDRAYGKLIAIYRAREDYDTINELLMNSGNEKILSTYQNYIARNPEFSVNEGYYTTIQILKLSVLGNGKIYYTVDGSQPDENSEQYIAPIILEDGDYTIKALFINENGIASSVVTKEYHIDNDVIPAPEVSLISGEYHHPTIIEILDDDGEIYYTTDGTTPTYASAHYTGAIPMPLGKSTYCFARVENGVTGETAERTFELTLETQLTPEQAAAFVVSYSLQIGKIYDEAGHFDESEAAYLYQFQYVTTIKDVGDYYIISELLRAGDGTVAKTGTNFAVDIYSGECFRMERDSANRVVLTETEKIEQTEDSETEE